MTPEEKQAMIQFFGTIHAQGKQTDQMIVGPSTLTPISKTIQTELSKLLAHPVNEVQPQQPVQRIEQVVQPVSLEAAVNELKGVESPVYNLTQPIREGTSLQSVDSISEELKKINDSLQAIVALLKPKNVKRQKITPKKQS